MMSIQNLVEDNVVKFCQWLAKKIVGVAWQYMVSSLFREDVNN